MGQLTICGIAPAISDQNLPTLSDSQPKKNEPTRAPTANKLPIQEASAFVTGTSNGESLPWSVLRYGDVQVIEAPTLKDKMFTGKKFASATLKCFYDVLSPQIAAKY